MSYKTLFDLLDALLGEWDHFDGDVDDFMHKWLDKIEDHFKEMQVTYEDEAL